MHASNVFATAQDDVVVLRWPEQSDDAARLTRLDRPHLLLVEPGAAPPQIRGCLADWIRLPADDADVRARLVALADRATRHPTVPQIDFFGVVQHHGLRVQLSPVDENIAKLLIGSFGDVVPAAEILAQVWAASDAQPKLRVHISGLRKRLAPLGLEISVIRNVGYRMHATDEPATRRTDDGQ